MKTGIMNINIALQNLTVLWIIENLSMKCQQEIWCYFTPTQDKIKCLTQNVISGFKKPKSFNLNQNKQRGQGRHGKMWAKLQCCIRESNEIAIIFINLYSS